MHAQKRGQPVKYRYLKLVSRRGSSAPQSRMNAPGEGQASVPQSRINAPQEGVKLKHTGTSKSDEFSPTPGEGQAYLKVGRVLHKRGQVGDRQDH